MSQGNVSGRGVKEIMIIVHWQGRIFKNIFAKK